MFAERIALVLALLGLPCAALAQPSCPSEPPILTPLQTDVGGDEFAQPHDALESPYPDDYSVIEPSHWRKVRLSMGLSHGGRCDITLLRPLPWVELTKAKLGEPIQLDMPEMGLAGAATVIAIEPCPEIKDPSEPGARPVIGKFVTTNARVVELLIEGLDEPIAATASHPFWSLDRNGWTAAGDLQPGERLRTAHGTATVKSVASRQGTETVYNVEVHKDHTFFVSDAKLWVHNTCIRFGRDANQISHVFRHTDALGLDRRLVQEAVESDMLSKVGQLTRGQPFNQIITVEGRRLQYTAYELADGTVNIGRVHGIP